MNMLLAFPFFVKGFAHLSFAIATALNTRMTPKQTDFPGQSTGFHSATPDRRPGFPLVSFRLHLMPLEVMLSHPAIFGPVGHFSGED
jgi:hypothetical protein